MNFEAKKRELNQLGIAALAIFVVFVILLNVLVLIDLFRM